MDKDSINYLNTMFQLRAMARQGLITEKDYIQIEEKMANKYNQKETSLYRLNDLIISPFRVINIIQEKEWYYGENKSINKATCTSKVG